MAFSDESMLPFDHVMPDIGRLILLNVVAGQSVKVRCVMDWRTVAVKRQFTFGNLMSSELQQML